jgi:uncharacterized caspase-like protein
MTTRLAFILGNGRYTSEKDFPKIDHAPKDAEKVFETLTARSTGLFSADKSIVAKNQSIQKLRNRLRAFFAHVKREDFVLIYFACHAKLIGGRRLVLAMRDTKPTELASTGLAVDQLIAYLDEKQVQRYVIVLDCCRAGAALGSPGVRHRGMINDANVHLLGGRGKVIVASSLEYQLAHELDALQHGLFSYYFINGLVTGEAVSVQQEFIDIRSLCNFVVSRIQDKHPEIAQEPVMSGEDETGQLIVGRNPRFSSTNGGSEILEYIKRSLNISDLSDKEKVILARRKKLREFIRDDISPIDKSFSELKHIIIKYGEAVGLDGVQINQEFDDYASAMAFESQGAQRLARAPNGAGTAMIFATAFQGAAFESPSLRSSLFGYYLREAFAGRASNEEGAVTLEAAYRSALEHMRISEEFRQTPVFVANSFVDPIITSKRVAWKDIAGRRIAVLVGIDQYAERRIPPLSFAESDVNSMAKLLVETGGFEVTALLGHQATHKNIVTVISDFVRTLKKDDIFLFYFSGHGYSMEDQGYAVVYDTDIDSISTSLSVSEIVRSAKVKSAQTSIIIFDTCMTPQEPMALIAL